MLIVLSTISLVSRGYRTHYEEPLRKYSMPLTLIDLPPEMITHILSTLPTTDFLNTRLVSTHLSAVGKHRLYKEISQIWRGFAETTLGKSKGLSKIIGSFSFTLFVLLHLYITASSNPNYLFGKGSFINNNSDRPNLPRQRFPFTPYPKKILLANIIYLVDELLSTHIYKSDRLPALLLNMPPPLP